MPDDQRGVVSPLYVVDDQDHRGCRAQLINQRDQQLDAGNRRVAVGQHPVPPAAEQVGHQRPSRVRRTRTHLKTVLHHPQRQALGEPIRDSPPDTPAGIACCCKGLGDKGRLADAGLALDPHHRSLAAAYRLQASAQRR